MPSEEDEEDRIPLTKSIKDAKEVSPRSVRVMIDAPILEVGKIKFPSCMNCDVMYSNTTWCI